MVMTVNRDGESHEKTTLSQVDCENENVWDYPYITSNKM
jgi:hypothetical protein